ncbi:MAG: TatD family hydrolase [Candidatus Baldrarchaeia archaeon]
MSPVCEIVDVHCHFDDYIEAGRAKEIIKAAREVGVIKIIGVAYDVPSNEKLLKYIDIFEELECCLGIHPWESWKVPDSEVRLVLDLLESNSEKVVGVGEVGLDFRFVRGEERWKRQREVFELFAKTAADLDLPMNVHAIKSENIVLEILRKHDVGRAVFHWYSGSLTLLEELLELGYYVSTNPSILYSQRSRKVVEITPLDRLLVESDSPYRFGDLDADPQHVRLVVEEVAKIKNTPLENVCRATTLNAYRLFNIRR